MIEPGDVVTAFLSGARETKRRPAIVVSSLDYHVTVKRCIKMLRDHPTISPELRARLQ